MVRTEHFEKLKRMYEFGPINRFFKPKLNVEEGRAEIFMEVDERVHHAAHAAHGSVYFKMLDDAAFFAVNSVVEEVFVLTVEFNIYLLRPVAAGRITSVGRLVHRGRQYFVAEAELKDERDRLLAHGSGSFLPSKITLSADLGYE
jgi:uncharacterized protein (TIGR00369 family)